MIFWTPGYGLDPVRTRVLMGQIVFVRIAQHLQFSRGQTVL